MFRIIRRRLIKLFSKIYDPLVNLKIGKESIKIPLSHQLTEIVRLYPEYNYNLPRIVSYVRKFVPDVRVIDIGANIGDTVAFIKNFADVPILCIDGEEKYVQLLRQNTRQYSNVSICQTLVGAETTRTNLVLKAEKGTAHLERSDKTTDIRTLDNILAEFPDFRNSKILKSDTDGFDTIILRACESFLKEVQPVLFFEFDPYLIVKNNDNPFDFIRFLKDCGYYYFIFYTNTGDYLLSCNIEQQDVIDQLIHYFSGRKMETFTDICAFGKKDEPVFNYCIQEEIIHFQKVRNY